MPEDLPPLQGYTFLSDPQITPVFIVERDGAVWMQGDEEVWNVRTRAPHNVLFRVADFLPAETSRSWMGGWLPVLVIRDRQGRALEILLHEEELWVSAEGQSFRFPGRRPVPPAAFENAKVSVRQKWDRWLTGGRVLPPTTPALDNAWRASLVQARCVYTGRHPHYGVGYYAGFVHDGFPPTTLATVECLFEYDHFREAHGLLSYYLERFVMADGRIDYYAPSVSEYGGLLSLCARMSRAPEGAEWLRSYLPTVRRVVAWLVRQRNKVTTPISRETGLIHGCPEADCGGDAGLYFHNNAQVWRGLLQLSDAAARLGDQELARECRSTAVQLECCLRQAVEKSREPDGLPPTRADKKEQFRSFTESREAAYANYRYYPELLEAAFLSREDALRFIAARETRQGEILGMTAFTSGAPDEPLHFDNWPLCSYARGLLELGERDRFMRALHGHALHHQTQDTFTAYEQVEYRNTPRRPYADFCVPAQLVLPRLLAWSFRYTKWDGTVVPGNGPQAVRT